MAFGETKGLSGHLSKVQQGNSIWLSHQCLLQLIACPCRTSFSNLLARMQKKIQSGGQISEQLPTS